MKSALKRTRPLTGAFPGLALVVAFAARLFVPAAAQEVRAPAGQKALKHEVSVTLKLIQVYVTDRGGKAVTDLGKEDFVLTDDGRVMEITDFERHAGGTASGAAEVLGATPAGRAAPLLSRKFYFLFDFARSDVFGVRWSRDASLHFLDTQILPADEVAVMVFRSFAGLALLENLTRDHARIRKIIEGIRDIPGYGMGGGIPLAGEGGPEGATGTGLPGPARSGMAVLDEGRTSAGFDLDWEHLKEMNYKFAKTMQDLAKSLRYVEGFKNILFFSSGVTRNILYDLEDSRVRREHEAMAKELASANCSVFSVNAEGQRAFLKSLDERGSDSLKILSEQSGGRYFHDVRQEAKIASEIQDVTGNYYVLGYPVEEAEDGRFHRIKVEIKREGCRVHVQEGYFGPKSFRKFTKFERELHLYDLALADRPQFQAPIRIPLVALAGPGEDGADLLLLAGIQVDGLDAVLGEEAEMIALVFDGRNEVVDTQQGKIRRSFLDPRDRVYHPYALVSVPPGEYRCRVVIRNLETGRGAVGSADVSVTGGAAGELEVFPPLLFIPDNPTFYLSFSKTEKKDVEREIAPLREIFPQVSPRLTPVLEAVESGISRLTVVARFAVPAGLGRSPEFAAELVDPASGARTAVPLEIVEISEGRKISAREGDERAVDMRIDTLVAEVSLPQVKPGAYSFVLEIRGGVTAVKAEAGRTITIR